jgi:hypothetical protein
MPINKALTAAALHGDPTLQLKEEIYNDWAKLLYYKTGKYRIKVAPFPSVPSAITTPS